MLRIGVLATRTGLSVRTLHHYDAIGLLRPSHRSGGGYRLYSLKDVMRLQQILLLRETGLSLDEINKSLGRDGQSLLETIAFHARRTRARIEAERRICRRLEETAALLRRRCRVTIDTIVETIEELTVFDKYFSEEQREWMKQRREVVGEERIKQVEAEWPTLIAEVRQEMAQGTPPDHPSVRALAARWRGLVEEFTAGNLGIAKSVATMYRNEPSARKRTGLDSEIMEYIGRAGAFTNPPGE